MSNQTIAKFIKNFDDNKYSSPDKSTQIEAGWYDWFCKDSSLKNKTYKLAPIVKRIAKSSKVDPNTMYVFFKNNCPCNGSLYDSFSICDMKTNNVLFWITPKSGHYSDNNVAQLFSSDDFKTPKVNTTVKDIYKFFEV
jgi:hypothetical protein